MRSAAALVALAAGLAWAAPPAGPRPGVVVAETTTVAATVVSVDVTTRLLTLRDAGGETLVVCVVPAVERLASLQPGDPVRAEYFEPLALALDREAVGRAMRGRTAVALTPGEDRPERAIASTIEITARVEAVDRRLRRVTVVGPEGGRLRLRVPDRVPQLEDIERGDEIYVRYTEPVAIDLR